MAGLGLNFAHKPRATTAGKEERSYNVNGRRLQRIVGRATEYFGQATQYNDDAPVESLPQAGVIHAIFSIKIAKICTATTNIFIVFGTV